MSDSPYAHELRIKFFDVGDSYVNRDHITRIVMNAKDSATLRLSNGDSVEVSGERSVNELIDWVGKCGVHSLPTDSERSHSDSFNETIRRVGEAIRRENGES